MIDNLAKPFRALDHRGLNQYVMDTLVNYIIENGLKNGDRLPSQMEIARQMKVSRTSLRETLAQLEARGVLKQVHGMGTYVSFNPDEYKTSVVMETSITEMIRALGKIPGTSEVILEWRPLPNEFVNCFPEEKKFICIQRTRTADGVPFAISIAFLAPGLIQSPDEIQMHKHNESLLSFLEEYCGETPMFFDDQIEIVFPEDEIAKKLEISPLHPVFKFIRHQYSFNRKLLVVACDYFSLKKLSLQVTRSRLIQDIKNISNQEEISN